MPAPLQHVRALARASRRSLSRWGGLLLGPRRHVANLQPTEGRADAILLGTMCVLVTSTFALIEACASLVAVGSWGGLLSVVGRAVLAPVATLLVVDVVLGAGRRHRSSLSLVPLLLTLLAADGIARAEWAVFPPPWPRVVGGALGVVLALWIRRSIPPEPDEDEPAAAQTRSNSKLVRLRGGLLGLGMLAASLTIASDEAYRAARNWAHLGPAPPGTPLHEFSVRNVDGSSLALDELKGHVSVVTLWATWCGACQIELGDLDQLDDRFVDEPRVRFLALNWEGAGYSMQQRQAIVSTHQRNSGMQLPVAIDDGSLAYALRVRAIPHTLVVGLDGVVHRVYTGRVRPYTIEKDVRALLNEGSAPAG